MAEAQFDKGLAVVKLGNDIQELIIARSDPRERAGTGQGGIETLISYDIDDVLSALCWAAASFIVQSGQFPTRQERVRAAKLLERNVLRFCPEVEQVLVELGRPNAKPN